MNYRHAYHAGNHADVFKHIVLTRVFELMKRKEKPFAFLDAHAGAGTYDLMGAEASKTFEWQEGIAKLQDPFDDAMENLLAPFRSVIRAANPDGRLRRYPGSPSIAAALLRRKDRLIFNELHAETKAMAEQQFAGDRRVRISGQDAPIAVAAALPVPERRAVILVDPPYERDDERDAAIKLLRNGLRRMQDAVYLVWYPVKSEAWTKAFVDQLSALAIPNMLLTEIRVREAFSEGPLAGSGMVIINPPWTLPEELATILPALAARLAKGKWGNSTLTWLSAAR